MRQSNRTNNIVLDVDPFLFLDPLSATEDWEPSLRIVHFIIHVGLYLCHDTKPRSGSEHIAGTSYYLWQLCKDMSIFYELDDGMNSSESDSESTSSSNVQENYELLPSLNNDQIEDDVNEFEEILEDNNSIND